MLIERLRFVVRTTGLTKKAAASILFGLGSFMLMADMLIAVLRNGDNGGNLFDMGFPGFVGYAGLLLWMAGIVILVLTLRDRSGKKGRGIKPVFLHGRKSFKCDSCGKRIICSTVSFHERMRCSCGKEYDVYEDERTDGI